MSEESTHAVPGDGQETEQRRNTTPETTKNETHSADAEDIQPEPHKRKRNYLPKTLQECERSKILKRGSTPLRERFLSDMQYNSLSKTTQKNYLNAVFDFIAHYYKSPKEITDEEIREYFSKGGTCRKVPIQAKMLAHLEQCWQVHRHPELLFPLCEINEATGKVIFSRAKFIPLSKTQALYDSICAVHCIKKRITPHMFRHCCATHLIELDASPQTVQNILGHKNLRTTTNYIHDSQVSSRRDAEFIEKLSDNLPD